MHDKKISSLLFLKNISLLLILLLFFSVFLNSACQLKATGKSTSTGNPVPDSSRITVLSQNTMLIPINIVAPEYAKRTVLISELLPEGEFDIVGLQEVFAGASQDSILKAWHLNAVPDTHGSGALWQPITGAKDVSELAVSQNIFGIKILDAGPNNKPAKISFGPYYVLGPDTQSSSIIKQDSGLLILSKFPIIAAGAFSFSDAEGTDRLANKGVVYARIKIGPSSDDYIHFFNTHLQSHGYSETRFKNLKELMVFVSNIVADDLCDTEGVANQNEKNVSKGPESKSDESAAGDGQVNQNSMVAVGSNSQEEMYGTQLNGIHPIIIVGDFNIRASLPDGWIKKADIISVPPGQKMADDSDSALNISEDYDAFMNYLRSFEETFMQENSDKIPAEAAAEGAAETVDAELSASGKAADIIVENDMAAEVGTAATKAAETATEEGMQDTQQYFTDLWQKFYPDDPGFTWIGKGWKTGENNPYGTDGNPFAIENGPPERIDYVVYYKGCNTLQLNPVSIKLFPEGSSGFQVSDHLGIVSVFEWQS